MCGNQLDREQVSGPPSILGTVEGPKTGLFGVLYIPGSPTATKKKKKKNMHNLNFKQQ